MDMLVVVDCDHTREFFNLLQPTGALFGKSPPRSSWVFRGCGIAAFALIPTALRPENQFSLFNYAEMSVKSDRERNTDVMQAVAELGVLARFFRIADAYGLPLPGDTQEARFLLQHRIETTDRGFDLIVKGDGWLPDSLLALAALAQHYGLPTRLLDWTRNSRVAAYFAARHVLRSAHSGALNKSMGTPELGWDRLAVWALNLDRLLMLRRQSPVILVTAPSCSNPNLHAQQGVFTMWKHKVAPEGKLIPTDRRPIDELIAAEIAPEAWSRSPLMYKITLPISKAGELFAGLLQHDYNAARLFPGHAGIVQSMEELELLYFFDHGPSKDDAQSPIEN